MTLTVLNVLTSVRTGPQRYPRTKLQRLTITVTCKNLSAADRTSKSQIPVYRSYQQTTLPLSTQQCIKGHLTHTGDNTQLKNSPLGNKIVC